MGADPTDLIWLELADCGTAGSEFPRGGKRAVALQPLDGGSAGSLLIRRWAAPLSAIVVPATFSPKLPFARDARGLIPLDNADTEG